MRTSMIHCDNCQNLITDSISVIAHPDTGFDTEYSIVHMNGKKFGLKIVFKEIRGRIVGLNMTEDKWEGIELCDKCQIKILTVFKGV